MVKLSVFKEDSVEEMPKNLADARRMPIGLRFRKVRELLGWTLKEIAQRLDYDESHLSRLERTADHELPVQFLRLMVRDFGFNPEIVLKADPMALLGGDEKDKKWARRERA